MNYSVVVPVYLREEDHKEVVMDTLKNIKQVSTDYELVVVDDGSPLDTSFITDWAETSVDEFCFFKHGKNKGISASWNTGKNNAQNEYVAIVNDDVKMPLLWLETLAGGFSDKTTGVTAPVEGGPHIKPYTNQAGYLRANHKFYPGYCFMLKRDRFFEDFDPQFTTNAGDVDYWHRIREADLKCMRVGMGVWHKEGDVLHKMDYDKISEESLEMFEDKWGFNPQEEYYT